MPLSREQIYNDLNGSEAKEILMQRFSAQLNTIPWLQRHLTLPRVRMKLSVSFEMYADQSTPEVQQIVDDFTIRTEADTTDSRSSNPAPHPHILAPEPHHFEVEEEIDSSPNGSPPDQLREEHGISIPTPVKNRLTGVTEDMPDVVNLTPGVTIERKRGNSPSPSKGATIVTQDFGSRVNRREGDMPKFKDSSRDHNQAPMPRDPRK